MMRFSTKCYKRIDATDIVDIVNHNTFIFGRNIGMINSRINRHFFFIFAIGITVYNLKRVIKDLKAKGIEDRAKINELVRRYNELIKDLNCSCGTCKNKEDDMK